MANWIYFTSSKKASLASTLGTIINQQFLWRSALKENGDLIPRVRDIRPGDDIVIAWRRRGKKRTAYLRAQVADPLALRPDGLVIDRIAGESAREFVSAGYPPCADGMVEGIRLSKVEGCHFAVRGAYGGNNAIHELDHGDAIRLADGGPIPLEALTERTPQRRGGGARRTGQRPGRRGDSAMSLDALDGFSTESADPGARAFDAYAMLDWSSRSAPCHGNNSIWVSSGAWSGTSFHAGPPRNIETRGKAIEELRRQLEQWRAEGKRVLVGFDFAFGYPSGFAKALGLATTKGAWKSLHAHFAACVKDDADNNIHNRDEFADECNRTIGAPGPFWGCAKSAATRSLTQHRVGIFTYPHRGLAEWRLTDLAARKRVTTQSVWKLNCGVSVGGQTILGIKHLEDLARTMGGHRWPFEGWTTPDAPGIWFAEIFPSLVFYPEWRAEYGRRPDRTQVLSCLRRAAVRDAAGELKGDFSAPTNLDAAALARIQDEEGWILWVSE